MILMMKEFSVQPCLEFNGQTPGLKSSVCLCLSFHVKPCSRVEVRPGRPARTHLRGKLWVRGFPHFSWPPPSKPVQPVQGRVVSWTQHLKCPRVTRVDQVLRPRSTRTPQPVLALLAAGRPSSWARWSQEQEREVMAPHRQQQRPRWQAAPSQNRAPVSEPGALVWLRQVIKKNNNSRHQAQLLRSSSWNNCHGPPTTSDSSLVTHAS